MKLRSQLMIGLEYRAFPTGNGQRQERKARTLSVGGRTLSVGRTLGGVPYLAAEIKFAAEQEKDSNPNATPRDD